MDQSYELANPNPGSLVESLRSVGYSLTTAIADIVDNSITANASVIRIHFEWAGPDSWVSIHDNGYGMSEAGLKEAMRPGTRNPTDYRHPSDLGRFGLGLKTASFSQCRKLTVWSRVQGATLCGRRWDLDHVSSVNEWRLQKILPSDCMLPLDEMSGPESGTLIQWEKMDKLVDDSPADSDVAHERFLQQISAVRDYLSMIFHRHLSGNTAPARTPLKIYLNGSAPQNLLAPWSPFEISKSATSQESPAEEIVLGSQVVRVKGYVLPHKDRISAEEFAAGGGPRGWTAQQGFYVYRNDRMILSGDWLGLGRGRLWAKEEQYRLARLSIDIPNSMDLEWSLDVKKSMARPPARLRARLTGLAEKTRNDARKVFVHRGQYGLRPASHGVVMEKPWQSHERNGQLVYKVNRSHPMVKSVFARLGPLSPEVEALIRLVEETVPVQKIWLDAAETDFGQAVPYEGMEEKTIMEDMKRTLEFLRRSFTDGSSAFAYLRATEPFNRYPHLIEQLAGGASD